MDSRDVQHSIPLKYRSPGRLLRGHPRSEPGKNRRAALETIPVLLMGLFAFGILLFRAPLCSQFGGIEKVGILNAVEAV